MFCYLCYINISRNCFNSIQSLFIHLLSLITLFLSHCADTYQSFITAMGEASGSRFVAQTFPNPVAIRLNEEKLLPWKQQAVFSIRGHKLLKTCCSFRSHSFYQHKHSVSTHVYFHDHASLRMNNIALVVLNCYNQALFLKLSYTQQIILEFRNIIYMCDYMYNPIPNHPNTTFPLHSYTSIITKPYFVPKVLI